MKVSDGLTQVKYRIVFKELLQTFSTYLKVVAIVTQFKMLSNSLVRVNQQLSKLLAKSVCSMKLVSLHKFCYCNREFSNVVKQSPHPDVVIPKMSFSSFVLQRLKRYGDNVAMIDSAHGKTVTFKQLYEQTIKCAAAFNNLGLTKNDVVGVCALGSVEYIAVLLATIACGAIATTSNPYYREGELLDQFTSSRPKFIFTDANSCRQVDNIAKDLPSVKSVFRLESDSDCDSYANLIEGANEKDFPNSSDVNAKEDVALLLYSSGTTGLPKGVMITHYSIIAGLILFLLPLRLVSTSSHYITFPMLHIGGIYLTLSSLIRGVKVLIDQERFSMERMFQNIEKYKITCLSIPPPILLVMSQTNLLTQYDASSVKTIVCGAAPIAASAFELVKKRYSAEIFACYGLTEFLPAAVADSLCPSNSVGVISNNTEIKIIDIESGKDLVAGQVGEILVKGPQMMKGYFNNPEATAETIDREGWLHTGDIGHYDDEGLLYIADRLKEMIKYKAFQIAPAELESALMKHPKIADAAVIGIPDEEAGELPKAFVVKASPTLSAKEVTKYIEETLVYYKHLRGGVEFIDCIPRSISGKILRRKLREQR